MEPIYRDIREAIIREAQSEKSGNRWIRSLKAAWRRIQEVAMAILQGRIGLLVGVLVVTALPISMLFTAGNASVSAADAAVVSPQPPGRQFKIVYDPAPAQETFLIRVGTFRTPSNASRVADFLEKHSLPVATQQRPDGLVVVTVGPFPERAQADTAVRLLQQSFQLTPPQIVTTSSGN
jgi:cell division septation protein DedD